MKSVMRRKVLGMAMGGAAAAALYAPQAQACVPTIGSAVGRILARLPGEAIQSAWQRWLESRLDETEEDQAENAALHLQMVDTTNSVETIIADEETKRHTMPLPPSCDTELNRLATQAQNHVRGAQLDVLAKKLDEATLTEAAPFVRPQHRAEKLRQEFGSNWLPYTTNYSILYRPTDLNADNHYLADAYILNVTGSTANSLAGMTSAYGRLEFTLHEQTSRVAVFKLARAPMVKYRHYITAFHGPSERSTLHQYVKETFGNDVWREQVNDFGSETQGLRMAIKLQAYINHVKLLRLRDLELAVAIESAFLVQKLVTQSRRHSV